MFFRARPATQPNTMTSLEQSIKNAERVLSYASIRGIEISGDDVKNIVEARRSGMSMSQSQEAVFWQSFMAVSKKILPATVATIASVDGSLSGSKSLHGSARKYRSRTILTLILLLIFQIYWLIGATLQSDIKEIRIRLEQLSVENEEGQAEVKSLVSTAADYAAHKAAVELRADKFSDKLYAEKISALADFDILKRWNFAGNFFLPKNRQTARYSGANPDSKIENHENEPEYFLWIFTNENVTQLQTSQIILTSLLKYILPLLYGALGASAYIVRKAAEEMQSFTYSESSQVRYQLRFYLGAVAGFSIAWFTSDPKSADTAGILQSLSPLALAFLAGYSVDLLFSVLDRFVMAFSVADKGHSA